jgi:putative membrane protein
MPLSRSIRLITVSIALGVCFVGTAASQTPSPAGASAPRQTGADQTFVTQAAQGGTAEVAKAKLALTKAASAEVKQFAQRMVDDHTKANEELKALATSKQITLPADAPPPAMAKLEKLEGAAFDQAYIADQMQDHQKAITLFEREAKAGTDAEVKAFAEKTLPTLKQHHALVRELSTKGKKGAS